MKPVDYLMHCFQMLIPKRIAQTFLYEFCAVYFVVFDQFFSIRLRQKVSQEWCQIHSCASKSTYPTIDFVSGIVLAFEKVLEYGHRKVRNGVYFRGWPRQPIGALEFPENNFY